MSEQNTMASGSINGRASNTTTEQAPISLSAGKRWLARLCFILIGVSTLANPLDYINLYNLVFGALLGLLFGGFYKWFLKRFLNTFNFKYKKAGGKDALNYAVENGLLYLTPYAIMIVLATFYLGWGMTVGFVTVGIMTVGGTSAMELGRLKGKQEIKNTLATSLVSFLFSTLWTLGMPFYSKVPGFIEGGIELLRSLLDGGGLL